MEKTIITYLNNTFKVFVRCNTYNQSLFIKDTLKGFVIQQTDFPFVCMVMDDCSTDGEQQVIIDWMTQECDMTNSKEFDIPNAKVIIVQHKTNNNCTFAFYLLKSNTWKERKVRLAMYNPWRNCCEYEAICEGDDYWTDPLKLQKQVDIVESNDSLMGCVTNCSVVDVAGNVLEEKRKLEVVKGNVTGRYSLRDFFNQSHQYPTLSVLYRNSHRQEVAKKCEIMRNPYMGDWTLWISLMCFGDMYYLDEVTCAYRMNPTSLTHDLSKYDQRRLGQAKDNFRLIPLVASVLPNEYKDIKKRLTKETAWMWFALANAHKHLHQYIKMVGCLAICGLKDPKMLLLKILHRN